MGTKMLLRNRAVSGIAFDVPVRGTNRSALCVTKSVGATVIHRTGAFAADSAHLLERFAKRSCHDPSGFFPFRV
jgi:hypothetical protein